MKYKVAFLTLSAEVCDSVGVMLTHRDDYIARKYLSRLQKTRSVSVSPGACYIYFLMRDLETEDKFWTCFNNWCSSSFQVNLMCRMISPGGQTASFADMKAFWDEVSALKRKGCPAIDKL